MTINSSTPVLLILVLLLGVHFSTHRLMSAQHAKINYKAYKALSTHMWVLLKIYIFFRPPVSKTPCTHQLYLRTMSVK